MSTIKMFDRDHRPITDWRRWVRPKEKDKQWKPGRSAMECARAWFTSPVPVAPPEIRDLLDSHGMTLGLRLVSGRPEHVTPLPERGEGRNHDLALVGRAGTQVVTVCVEAKADEPFGDDTIGGYWRKRQNTKSRAPKRIEALLKLLVGANANPVSTPWANIRYQLLTAAAGTVLQAAKDGAGIAVLVVHEFHTTETDDTKLQENAREFAKFVEALLKVPVNNIRDGVLYGPHQAAGVELLVGKAVYAWDV